ncbi:MAG TPA: hypothetical protein VIY90_14325 [Steroidobacteraceae bacterium]
MNDELVRIRQWAQERLDAYEEPPWARQRYQYLLGLLSPPSPRALPRGANIVRIDTARRRGRAMTMCR